MTRNIDLDQYYTAEEAAHILSKNICFPLLWQELRFLIMVLCVICLNSRVEREALIL